MADDIRGSIQAWDQGVWCLAALTLAYGSEDTALRAEAAAVLGALALPTSPLDVQDATGVPADLLAAQAAAPVAQVARLLGGETSAWDDMPEEALVAQGRTSSQMAEFFSSSVLPLFPELQDALARESRMLDVGTGAGLLALAFADTFPHLRVTGLDVMPRVLAIADRFRAGHPAGDRVELVEQDVATLSETAAFDLVWLPAPFIPAAVLPAGVRACAAALKPGGRLMVAHGKFGDDPLENALNRFKTACFGGAALDDDEAESLLAGAGLEDLRRVPTPPGAPALVLGRSPG